MRAFVRMEQPALAIVFLLGMSSVQSIQHANAAPQIPIGPITVRLSEFATDLMEDGQLAPSDMSPLDDGTGRIAVMTLTGRVRLLDESGTHLDTAATPYFDTEPIDSVDGATGIAVHPNFGAAPGTPGRGKIYTVFNEEFGLTIPDFPSPNGEQHADVLVEWTADDPSSDSPVFTRRDVIRFGQGRAGHNVGDIAFDSQGFLFTASGDGRGDWLDAQDLTNHHGTVFRIDPLLPAESTQMNVTPSVNGQYSVPDDNPFVSDPLNPNALPEIYALGLRQPYRLTIDQQTDRLLIGDVGSARREEVSLVEAGLNYGWPYREGSTVGPEPSPPMGVTFEEPVFDYARDDGDTVIGGLVYRGSGIPELAGKYIFADFGRQVTAGQALSPTRLFYGDLDTGDVSELMISSTGEPLVDIVGGDPISETFIFSVGEDADGELYLLVGDDPGFFSALNPDGRLLRLEIALPGDGNGDGIVDGLDYLIWAANYGQTDPPDTLNGAINGDYNKDETVDGLDYLIWAANYGTGTSVVLPEPSTLALAIVGLVGVAASRRRRPDVNADGRSFEA